MTHQADSPVPPLAPDPIGAGRDTGRVPVSVVIPVYAGEAHIAVMLAQLRLLDPQPVEITVVLDGAQPAVYAALTHQDVGMDNLRVVQLDAALGAGQARNEGIARSTGEYVWFCDCDDYWAPSIVGHLYREAVERDADIVVCTASSRRAGHTKEVVPPSLSMRAVDKVSMPGSEALLRLLHGRLSGHLWNKLFRRALLSETTFSTMVTHQDLLAVLGLLPQAGTVVFTDQLLYTYVQSQESNLNRNIHHERTLIPIRDRARCITRHGDAPAREALAYFELRAIAIPILQLCARLPRAERTHQQPPAEWARRTARTSSLMMLIRSQDLFALVFVVLTRLHLDMLSYRLFRRLRVNQPAGS